jgi:hypothetical protein
MSYGALGVALLLFRVSHGFPTNRVVWLLTIFFFNNEFSSSPANIKKTIPWRE